MSRELYSNKKDKMMSKKVFEVFNSIINEKKVEIYLELLKDHHKESYKHSLRTCLICIYLGYKNNLSEEKIRLLGYAGLLHDIGKLNTPVSILSKKGKLTKKETAKIREHPRRGFIRLKEPEFEEVKKIIIAHHEYCLPFYPRSGEERRKSKRNERRNDKEYREFAQILSAADNYEALSGVRSYHEPLECDEIKDVMDSQFKGKKKYVKQVIEKCLRDHRAQTKN